MAWSDYETLQCYGEFGLVVSIGYDLLKFKKPGNFVEPAINTAHSEGNIEFALKFEFLPKSLAGGINPGEDLGGLQSRADYLWNVFNRCKQAGDKPIIIEFEMPGSTDKGQILCVFKDDRMDYTLFAARLFSTGLVMEQVRVEGGSFGDNQVTGGNPLSM